LFRRATIRARNEVDSFVAASDCRTIAIEYVLATLLCRERGAAASAGPSCVSGLQLNANRLPSENSAGSRKSPRIFNRLCRRCPAASPANSRRPKPPFGMRGRRGGVGGAMELNGPSVLRCSRFRAAGRFSPPPGTPRRCGTGGRLPPAAVRAHLVEGGALGGKGAPVGRAGRAVQ
jgi:hypothetical protein